MDEAGGDRTKRYSERSFFLHIPKTAGTSLREYIYGHFDRDETFPFNLMAELERATPPVRRDYHYYEGHFPYDLMRLVIGAEPVTMTMLRDPLEQVLSLFSFLPVNPTKLPMIVFGEDVDIARALALPIDVYFAQPIEEIPTIFRDMQTRLIASKDVLVYAPWLADTFGITLPPCRPEDLGPNLAEAKRRLDRFAFVGLTERFRESIALLAYTFGWRPVREMRVRNVTADRIRRDHLAGRMVAHIQELNALDIALYAHACELFDERYRAMADDLARRFGGRAPFTAGELDDLLELHYVDHFASQYPAERSVHVDFTRPIHDMGWHHIERHPEYGRVRWTGPGTTASVDVPIAPGRDVRIAFRALASLAPDILERVTLRVNGIPISLDREQDAAGGIIFSGTVPGRALANGRPFARVTIETVRTVRPIDLDPASGDDRALGVLVNWINLAPTLGRTAT
jgi:hypothetical protein